MQRGNCCHCIYGALPLLWVAGATVCRRASHRRCWGVCHGEGGVVGRPGRDEGGREANRRPRPAVFCSFNIKKGMKDKKNGYFCFHLHKSSHCRVTEGGSVDGISAKDR